MEHDRFDSITRAMAAGASRRQVLRRMAGGIMGGALALTGSRVAGSAQSAKVTVCHRTGSEINAFEFISVSVNAVPEHEAHGDLVTDLQSDVFNCGGCGVVCDDGNACTINTCTDGLCSYPPVDCSKAGDQCNVGTCNPVDGSCYADPAPRNGASCADGNLCTTGDVCDNGTCAGTAVDCSTAGGQCTVGTCDPATGGCYADPAPREGAACDSGDVCTTGEVCTNGECVGTAIDCADESDQCNVGICNQVDGSCDRAPVVDGTECTAPGGRDGKCLSGTCDPVELTCGGVAGTVSSSEGGPISDAKVTVFLDTIVTEKDGRYAFPCVAHGGHNIYVSAPGFSSQIGAANIESGVVKTVNFTLTPVRTT